MRLSVKTTITAAALTIALASSVQAGELLEKQKRFTGMVAKLVVAANNAGYSVVIGEVHRFPSCSHGHANSLHRLKLAVDIHLFIGDRYLSSTEDHRALGLLWESWGGAWGGRWGDGNHYSLAHGGMK